MLRTAFIFTFTICLLTAGAVGVLAQADPDLKIGYIDSQRIFAEYSETQEAERIYKREVEQWKGQAARMEQEIVKLQDQIKSQSLMVSEEKQREMKLDLDKKMDEYQRFMADTFGDNGIAQKRNEELTQPIVEKINRILETMAKDDGITLVFDISQANIVYANKQYDLTDRVLGELNKTQ
jgi:outer membrane protein